MEENPPAGGMAGNKTVSLPAALASAEANERFWLCVLTLLGPGSSTDRGTQPHVTRQNAI